MQLITEEEYQKQITLAYFTGQFTLIATEIQKITPEISLNAIQALMDADKMMDEAKMYYQSLKSGLL